MSKRLAVFSNLLALGLLLSSAACQSPPPTTPLAAPLTTTPATRALLSRISVMSNGWHTDLVLPRSAALARAVPEVADFPQALFFSFGWGDAEFYRAPDPGLLATLGAAIAPTPAVVHLVGLRRHPAKAFPSAEVLDLQVGKAGEAALLAHLRAAFDRPAGRRAKSVGPGLYDNSLFYDGTGKFHIFNTCNSWTARGLAAAGLLAGEGDMIRAEAVMSRLRGP